MKKIYFLCLLCVTISLMSCHTTQRIVEVPVPVATHDTLRWVTERIDSIHVTDSTVVHGDTVDRWHTRYVQRILRDTVFKHQTDTVTKVLTVTVTKEVAKRGPLEKAGLVALVGIALLGAVKIKRRWL